MTTAPFFSVIIPVYNRAKALRTALASVLAQSCQDFEIVIVDDGSKDDPRSVAQSLGDPRIRFLRQDNRGGGAARNAAIDAALGRFIAPLDSDDIFLPHHLQTMKTLLEGKRNTVGYARMIVDRGQGCTFLKPPRAIREDEHMANYLLCNRGFVPTITAVVETATARRVRYDENLRVAEDADFAIRLFLSGCQFTMIGKPGAVWKDIADPGRTSASNRGKRLGDWLERMRPSIPASAYHGGRGWAYAKLVAKDNKWRALGLYLRAVMTGCYRPRMAMVIFLQIFLGNRVYRRLADCAISWLGAGLHEAQLRDTTSRSCP